MAKAAKKKTTKKATKKKVAKKKTGKRGPAPGNGGAPKKDIDWNEVEKLCAMQATQEEIADWFYISVDTLNIRCKELYGKTFSEYFKQKRTRGKISLRRAQWLKAITGENTSMQIWLGKQWLGQKDQVESDVVVTSPDKSFDTSKMSPEEYREFLKTNIKKSMSENENN